jgi:hypothetical protein
LRTSEQKDAIQNACGLCVCVCVCVCLLYINYSSKRLELIFIGVFEIREIMSLVYQMPYFMEPSTVIIANNGQQAHVLKE